MNPRPVGHARVQVHVVVECRAEAVEERDSAEFRAGQRQDIARFTTRETFDEDRWQWLESRLHYMPGNFADPAATDHPDENEHR